MKATTRQKERRRRSFPFVYDGRKSWFYLCEDRASFHQPNAFGQHNVFGLPVKTLINALKKCGYIALFLCLPVLAEAKEVVIHYDDFLAMVSKVEHSEKLKNKAMAENGVLLKLRNEQDTIIKIQADQIKACEDIVQQQEQLGATQEQIGQAVHAQLLQKMQELENEKANRKWWAGGGVTVGVLATIVVMWVMN